MTEELLGQNKPLNVVCIGASAGGLQAVESFLATARGSHAAFCYILIIHSSADDMSMIPDLLARHVNVVLEEARTGDDLLDMAKIEAGKIQLERLSFDLWQELENICHGFSEKAEQKGIVLDLTIEPDIPPVIEIDPLRFRQVLLNLLSNALKFTQQGCVSLHAHWDEENSKICIDVKDSGIGIGEEQKVLLFKPFSQVDASMSRRFGGTGLGLCLSKRLAEAMAGDVKLLDSTSGEGSVFRFEFIPSLPKSQFSLAAEPDRGPAKCLAPLFKGLRLLVVDDGLDDLFLLKSVLGEQEIDVFCAANREEAINSVLREEPDFLLTDMQLPDMDGTELVRKLRELGYEFPIFCMSADPFGGEDSLFKEGVSDAFFTKPLNFPGLMERMATFADHARQTH